MEPITKEEPGENMGLISDKTNTNHGGGGSYVYLAVSFASLLAFTCGTAYSWSSPIIPKLTNPDLNPLSQPVTAQETSWVAGSLALGSTFGPMLTFYLSDKIGRKKTMLLFAVPALASFLLLAFAKAVWLYYVARFMQGFGVSAAFSVLPVFIGEISESHNRGGLSCMQGVFIISGLLFSYVVGPYVTVQIFCLACAIPPTLFLVLFWCFVPETPYYLIAIKDHKGARESLAKYRGKSPEQVEKELLEITRNVEESFANKATIGDLFRTRGVCKALFVSIGLVFFQQVFGINVVLSYMQTIFAATGSSIPEDLSTIIMGIVQVCAVVMAALLIDRLGRRLLLLVSAVGSGLAQTSMGVYFYLKLHDYNVAPIFWLPIASLFVFMVCFNFGFSTVPFTIMAELFPPNLKMVATTIACCILLFLAFVMTLTFPILDAAIGIANCFWLFGGFCAAGTAFVYLAVPETKGKTLAEVQKMLGEK